MKTKVLLITFCLIIQCFSSLTPADVSGCVVLDESTLSVESDLFLSGYIFSTMKLAVDVVSKKSSVPAPMKSKSKDSGANSGTQPGAAGAGYSGSAQYRSAGSTGSSDSVPVHFSNIISNIETTKFPIHSRHLWVFLLFIMLFCLLPRGAIDASSIIISEYRYV